MTHNTVVIVGGGIGGLVAARRLRRKLDASDHVIVCEPSPVSHLGPSLLWVMTGARRPERIATDLRLQRRRGIEVLEAQTLELDPGSRVVKTTDGAVHYDRAIVAVGAELAPEALPGFAESAHNVYSLEGARSAGAAL